MLEWSHFVDNLSPKQKANQMNQRANLFSHSNINWSIGLKKGKKNKIKNGCKWSSETVNCSNGPLPFHSIMDGINWCHCRGFVSWRRLATRKRKVERARKHLECIPIGHSISELIDKRNSHTRMEWNNISS